MATPKDDFAIYCCELLSGVGPCVARRMFGGYGISTSGLTLALVADLGGGEKLCSRPMPTPAAGLKPRAVNGLPMTSPATASAWRTA